VCVRACVHECVCVRVFVYVCVYMYIMPWTRIFSTVTHCLTPSESHSNALSCFTSSN